jgi:predicted amidophosphoribosyltransferase
VGVGTRFVCPDCSRAALGGALPYGRCVATYRGRAGSPRRSLGEAYRAVVAFKERRPDWPLLALPLARALASGVKDLVGGDTSCSSQIQRPLFVPVPSFEGRRPHVHLLASLAAIKVPEVAVGLDVLYKSRDFTQKGLSRVERLQECDGAYAVRAAARVLVHGRRIIVADDLMTTGATLEACARVLTAAGASSVDGASVVRVIRAPPERVVSLAARQLRLQLRELDARARAPIAPEPGWIWVVFACSARCAVTALAGPYELPTFDAVSYHRWICRCGTSHVVRIRREWRGAARECVAVGVDERRPSEILVGTVQGIPKYL